MDKVEVIFSILAAAGFISYPIWVIHLLIKKRYHLAILLVLLPLLFLLFLKVYENQKNKNHTAGIFSVPATIGRATYTYSVPLDFSGDGYFFNVSPLPEAIRSRFLNADDSLYNSHPKEKTGEHAVPWFSSPASNDYAEYITFALSTKAHPHPMTAEFKTHFEKLRSAIFSKGSYISILYKTHKQKSYKDSLRQVELFLVDLTENRLYNIYIQ